MPWLVFELGPGSRYQVKGSPGGEHVRTCFVCHVSLLSAPISAHGDFVAGAKDSPLASELILILVLCISRAR